MLYHQAVQICKCVSNGNGEPVLELDVRTMRDIFGKASDKPIAIYCISGKYRSGKSFLLCLLLQYLQNEGSDDWIDRPVQHSFKYSNSDEGVTSGIWMWSEPFFRKDNNGSEVAVFLMDNQGWHDSKSTIKETGQLFALSSLLSSVMIFNVEKRVTEIDLQFLQKFSFNAKIIDERNNEEPFQKLVILVRDWISTDDYPFGFYDNGTKINGKDFIGKKLKPQSDQSIESQKLRELIHLNYQEISACLLPHPGEIAGENLYDSSKMSNNFRVALEKFVPALFSSQSIKSKLIGAKILTGADLISLAFTWTKSIDKHTWAKSYPEDSKYQQCYQEHLALFDTLIQTQISNSESIEQVTEYVLGQNKMCEMIMESFNTCKELDDDFNRLEFSSRLQRDLEIRQNHYIFVLEEKIDQVYLDNQINRIDFEEKILSEKRLQQEQLIEILQPDHEKNVEDLEELQRKINKLQEQINEYERRQIIKNIITISSTFLQMLSSLSV